MIKQNKTQPRRYQREDLKAIDAFDGRALLCLDMGLGKTLEFLWWVTRREKLPAVVICPASVKYQWAEQAREKCGISSYICEGRKPPAGLSLKGFDLILINYDILKEWIPLIRKARCKTVGIDECQALRNRASQRTRNVRRIVKGRKHVIGMSGSPIENRPAELWPMLNMIRPDKFSRFLLFAFKYCNPPETPILTADMTSKKLGDVRVGDRIIGWGSDDRKPEERRKARCKTLKTKLWEKRCLKVSIVKAVRSRKAPLVKVTMESGRTFRCTPDHLWWTYKNSSGSDGFQTAVPGRNIHFLMDPIPPLPKKLERVAGWLGGIYDGEGCWPIIGQSKEKNPEVYEAIEKALDTLDFKHAPTEGGIRIIGGRETVARFVAWCKPHRRKRIDLHIFGNKFATKDRVSKVEPDGEGKVISLETSTGNYVAWGYCSKNCKPKKERGRWNYDGAANLDRLNRRLRKTCMIRRIRTEVLHDLPPLTIEPVLFDLPPADYASYKEAERDVVKWLRKYSKAKAGKAKQAEGLARMAYLKKLTARMKLRPGAEWLSDFLKATDDKIAVFYWHKLVGRHFRKVYKDGMSLVDGSVTGRKRHSEVRAFVDRSDRRLFFGNLHAAGVGLDGLQKACHFGAFFEFGWKPSDFTQVMARLNRFGQTKGTVFYLLTARGTVEHTLCKIVQGKQNVVDQVLDGKAVSDFEPYTLLERALLNERTNGS